jgi:hypothetical protein
VALATLTSPEYGTCIDALYDSADVSLDAPMTTTSTPNRLTKHRHRAPGESGAERRQHHAATQRVIMLLTVSKGVALT